MKNVEDAMIRHTFGFSLTGFGAWALSLMESSVPVLQWLLLLVSTALAMLAFYIKVKKEFFSKSDRSEP